jgi:hypothetical protein
MEYLSYWKVSQRWVSDGGAFIPAAKNFLAPEKSYLRTKPAPAKGSVWGSCTLGAAEENAIRRALDEDEVNAIHRMMEEPIYAEDVMSE